MARRRTRREKLRDLAEHPATPRHEAASARARLEEQGDRIVDEVAPAHGHYVSRGDMIYEGQMPGVLRDPPPTPQRKVLAGGRR